MASDTPAPPPPSPTPWWLFAVALAARVTAWLLWCAGMVYPDELYQSLEPGHLLAFGRGGLAWEWNDGLRTWLVPFFYAVPFRVLAAVGLSGPGQLIAGAQLLHVVISLLAVAAAWRLGWRAGGRGVALLAALTAAVFPALLFWSPRTLTDVPAAALVVTGLALLAGLPESPRPARTAALAALCAGGAFIFRFTSPLFFMLPGVVLLLQRRWRPALALAGGFALVLLFAGMVDWATWGAPFHSLRKYLTFNVIEGGAKRWGVAPAEWYLAQLFRDLGPVALVTLAVAARGSAGLGSVGPSVLFALTFMSMQEHKEERFLLPVFMLLPALLAGGAWQVCAGLARGRWVATVALLLALVAGHGRAYRDKDWKNLSTLFAAVERAARAPDVRGIALTKEWVVMPGLVGIRRDVPVVALENLHALPDARSLLRHELLNYVVGDATQLPRLREGCGCNLVEVARYDNWVVWRK